jgi:hypothetical protein
MEPELTTSELFSAKCPQCGWRMSGILTFCFEVEPGSASRAQPKMTAAVPKESWPPYLECDRCEVSFNTFDLVDKDEREAIVRRAMKKSHRQK